MTTRPDPRAGKARWTSSCRAKIARADEHLNALYDHMNRWGNSEPYRMSRQSDPSGREHVFKLHIEPKPYAWQWAVLMGDALNNLRGALDHLVYALAMKNSGDDPPLDDSKLSFPICSSSDWFQSRRHKSAITSLSAEMWRAIERAQPYNRRKPNGFAPLWFLGQLNDIDKHRLPHLSALGARPKDISVGAPRGTFQALWNDGPIQDGAAFFKLVLAEADPTVEVNLHVALTVVLDVDGHRWGVEPLMRSIRREVVVVCRYLSRFF